MLDKVQNAIKDFNMISEGDTVLCCLSGGADSVTLLLCLKQLGYKVKACHVNHLLRDEESFRDENFCINLCEKLDIALAVKRIDVSAYCANKKLSIEQGARNLRYNFFEECNTEKIATAHTLSDSLETAIFNLTRGTGIKGLCGIPPVREKIIRPLIYCKREEIEKFLKSNNQNFVIDSTNLTDDYNRNKIRNNIIPVLSKINNSIEDSFFKSSKNLRSDMNYLEKVSSCEYQNAKLANGFDARKIENLDYAVKSRIIYIILSKYNIEPSHDRINAILSILKSNGKIDISCGKYAICSQNTLRIVNKSSLENDCSCIKVEIPSEYYFMGKRINLFIVKTHEENLNINKNFTNYELDYDKIIGKVFLRNRQNGDKIKLAGRDFTSSIKKLFNENIPIEKRNSVVMLSDDSGLIFVEGFGISDRVKVDKLTKNVLICQLS